MNRYTEILLKPEDTIQRAVEVIDASSIQIALVVDQDGRLLGTITDGDIRRGILRGVGMDERAEKIMNTYPVTAQIGSSRNEVMNLMTSRVVKQLPLVDEDGRVVGLELLDDLLHGPTIKENPVIILAGGQGSRLRPLTSNRPKPLLKVGGRPVLELIVRQVHASGFHRLYVSVNYLGSQIEEYFGNGQRHGVSIEYLKESEPLGTAGPLALMPGPLNFPCIVVNGDLVTKVNFERMLEFHEDGEFGLTIGVKEYPVQLPFGVVVTEEDRVVEFQEKPVETRLINAGVYIIDPGLFSLVPHKTYYDMSDLIQNLLCEPQQRVGAFPIHEYWMDIGTESDYRQAQWDYPEHFGS